jgi:hypothetical protein
LQRPGESRVNESTVVRGIKKAVMDTWPEAVIYKIHGSPYQEAGIPDLLLCVRGQFIALEVKYRAPGESRNYALSRVTPRQQHQIDRINSAGGLALAVLSADEAVQAIRSVLR